MVAARKPIIPGTPQRYISSPPLPDGENFRIITTGPAMHFAAIPIQGDEGLVETHHGALAPVSADRCNFHFDVPGHVDNVIDALQGRPHFEFHDRRGLSSGGAVTQDPPDQPAGRPVIGMHLPLMRYINHVRAPLPQRVSKTSRKSPCGSKSA